MVQCKICIETDECYLDPDVFIDTKLVSTPRIGETIWLSIDTKLLLEKMVNKNEKIRQNYHDWVYGDGHISFDDAVHVKAVVYQPEEPFVLIVLGRF